MGEFEDGDLVLVPDVHRIVLAGPHEPHDAFHEVLVVAETAGLPPLPEDRQRFSPKRLGDEGRRDAAVRGAHPGTVGVEDPDDPRVDSVFTVVGHGQGLREALGLVVDPPDADGIDVAPVTLRLGVDLRVAVDLRGGCEEEARALGFGQAEGVVGAQGADLQDLDRDAFEIDRTRRTGEVHDEVHLAFDVQVFRNVPLEIGESFVYPSYGRCSRSGP